MTPMFYGSSRYLVGKLDQCDGAHCAQLHTTPFDACYGVSVCDDHLRLTTNYSHLRNESSVTSIAALGGFCLHA